MHITSLNTIKICSFETSASIYPAEQLDIPEVGNPEVLENYFKKTALTIGPFTE